MDAIVPPTAPTPPMHPTLREATVEERLTALEVSLREMQNQVRALRAITGAVDEHEDRLDTHDIKFDQFQQIHHETRRDVHQLQGYVERLSNALSIQGLVIERVDKNTARVLELLQPKAAL